MCVCGGDREVTHAATGTCHTSFSRRTKSRQDRDIKNPDSIGTRNDDAMSSCLDPLYRVDMISVWFDRYRRAKIKFKSTSKSYMLSFINKNENTCFSKNVLKFKTFFSIK